VEQKTTELAIANEKLAKLDEAKTEFLHIISHEIRTPLNGIIGSWHFIKNKPLTDETDFLIGLLDKSVKRLEKFSFQTMDISHLQTEGVNALKKSKVDITLLIEGCLADLKELLKSKKISATTRLNGPIKEITADQYFIRKSLGIILENAINHSSENANIIIESFSSGEMFIIKITDKGLGFPDEMMDQAFPSFITGKDHINDNAGLDLHFVKLVMNAHSGEIEIGNNADCGGFVMLKFKIEN
jgi:two-component system sensor histidine kinase/response regulator